MDLNVLIVGGGIHGVGLLHDLASRRIQGVHLAENALLAAGTSSRSTKLVHGGLRYLEHFGQWSLVREALRERGILLRILKGLVQPLPLVLPAFAGDRPPWMIRAGLVLYDMLAGDGGLPAAKRLSKEDVLRVAPYLNAKRVYDDMKDAFLYYDAQMLDDVIVRLAAEASRKLGATYEEGANVVSVVPVEIDGVRGFRCIVRTAQGDRELTTRMVVNAGGAWANANLLTWGITPEVSCLLNVGTHLLFAPEVVSAKASECAATLLQNEDGRVVFFLPWNGQWLFGTTESVLRRGDPRGLKPPEEDVRYLLAAARHNLSFACDERTPEEVFCGVRTMPFRDKNLSRTFGKGGRPPSADKREQWAADPFASPFYVRDTSENISALSRETVVDEALPGLLSIYGGKYTTYRSQCERVGADVSRRLGLGGTTGTQVAENWFIPQILEEHPEIFRSSSSLRAL
ncbi:MAG: FAD-dependent oxidoreductase [Silvanigrellales bacterium]|nr:FAD-dependent oxidoreductase [Silvanigrellales bacterium]